MSGGMATDRSNMASLTWCTEPGNGYGVHLLLVTSGESDPDRELYSKLLFGTVNPATQLLGSCSSGDGT